VTALAGGRLLDAWEEGSVAGDAAVRPLHLLRAVEPERSLEELGAEPLGRRDARLGALRRRIIGPVVEATTQCPSCTEPVETSFDVDDLWPAEDVVAEVDVAVDGFSVACRPITTADLAAVRTADDVEAALFARCVVRASRDGHPVAPHALPPSVRAEVEASLADADPCADVVLALVCPACDTAWSAPFDLASFLWEEVDHAARRLLAEVDVLARAYGWREPDILALSPWRRRRYLELAQA
jgi:hypothetical protein